MATHKVRITQVSRVERSIVVEVEGGDAHDAVETQRDADAPASDDPRWTTVREELMNEDVEAA